MINRCMNYFAHYQKLIAKAQSRKLNGYKEKHHIIPKCLGGNNEKSNIIELTPEEHYLAHLLLVKMYPNNHRLVHAAVMMTVNSFHSQQRSNNKLYGWLRRACSISAKRRIGNKNGSFGKPWFHDPKTGTCSKFIPDSVPAGWLPGRVKKTEATKCCVCNKLTGMTYAKWCDDCRPPSYVRPKRQMKDKDSFTDHEKLEALKSHQGNIRQALFSLGLNDSGAQYRCMKRILATVSALPTKQE